MNPFESIKNDNWLDSADLSDFVCLTSPNLQGHTNDRREVAFLEKYCQMGTHFRCHKKFPGEK